MHQRSISALVVFLISFNTHAATRVSNLALCGSLASIISFGYYGDKSLTTIQRTKKFSFDKDTKLAAFFCLSTLICAHIGVATQKPKGTPTPQKPPLSPLPAGTASPAKKPADATASPAPIVPAQNQGETKAAAAAQHDLGKDHATRSEEVFLEDPHKALFQDMPRQPRTRRQASTGQFFTGIAHTKKFATASPAPDVPVTAQTETKAAAAAQNENAYSCAAIIQQLEKNSQKDTAIDLIKSEIESSFWEIAEALRTGQQLTEDQESEIDKLKSDCETAKNEPKGSQPLAAILYAIFKYAKIYDLAIDQDNSNHPGYRLFDDAVKIEAQLQDQAPTGGTVCRVSDKTCDELAEHYLKTK